MIKPDVISQNNYFMGMLLANNYDPYFDADSDTISLVTNVSLQHPFYGGDAVYLARTMLHQDVFDVLPPFRRKNHSALLVNEAGYLDRFYPNPANKSVTFTSSLLFAENEQLVIYNSFGTIIKKITLPKMQNTIAFDIGDLATSVYYSKIISTNSERKVQKLVIIQ